MSKLNIEAIYRKYPGSEELALMVDLREIRVWNNSKNDAFEELCCQLASFEPMPPGSLFSRGEGAGGDGGVECYWVLPDGSETGWQAKYFFELGKTQWGEISESVSTALSKHPRLTDYTVCLPINLTDLRQGRKLSQRDRWNRHVAAWQGIAAKRGMNVTFHLWGEFQIVERLSRPQAPYQGRSYFWFHQEELSIEWMRAHFEEARANVGARYTPELSIEVPEAALFEGLGATGAFFGRIRSLYGELARSWRKAEQWQRSLADEPILTEHLARTGVKVQALADELNRVSQSFVVPIDFERVTRLAREAFNEVDSLVDAVREVEEHSLEAGAAPEPDRTEHGNAYLRSFRHEIGGVADIVREAGGLASDEACRAANASVALLLGDAGTGKTHLFCDVTARRLQASLPTILLLGQHFGPGEPWRQITEQLHLTCTRDEFLGAVDALAQATGHRVLIMIDAINEGDGLRVWPNHLGGVLATVGRFPSIGLALSCRSSYMEAVVPRELWGRVPAVQHRGFANHEYVASKTFFDYYHIERPNVPLLVPEFSNPLFLKMFCEGLHRLNLTRVPRGLSGVTGVFGLFIDAIHATLCRRLDYDPESNLVRRAIERLAQRMAETGNQWVERAEAAEIVNQVLAPRGGFRASLFGELLSEGLLAADLMYERDEQETRRINVIRFPYERFTDHMIVRHLLDEHLSADNPEGSFSTGEPLGRLLEDEVATYRFAGWIEALSIQVPERLGRELVDVVPRVREWSSVRSASIRGIIWRASSTVNDATWRLLEETLGQEGRSLGFDVLLSVAPNPEHRMNGRALHDYLMSLDMPHRDSVWSTYLHSQHRRRGPVERLIEWAWDAPKLHISDEAVELASIAITWFFTTSNRFVRDRATKALVSLLAGRPRVLLQVLEQFVGVDDVYVLERLLAVCYGVSLLCDDTPVVTRLASRIYQLVFSSGNPPVHILLRDYARGIIEVAAYRGMLPSDVDLQLVRPPYHSTWPLDIPDEHELRVAYRIEGTGQDDEWSLRNIHWSVTSDDFGTYVIDSALRGFTSRPLHGEATLQEPGPADPSEAWRAFLESVSAEKRALGEKTDLDTLQRVLRLREAHSRLEAESTDDGENSEIPRAEPELPSFLAHLLGGLDAADDFLLALDDDETGRLGHVLEVQREREERQRREERFDIALAKRWILKRVLDMGWSVDLHGRFDRNVDRGQQYSRDANKPERIGKKYQWIALNEFLGHIADNIEHRGDPWDVPRPYEGPWQIGARDIDPSLLAHGPLESKSAPAWWAPSYDFEDMPCDQYSGWIRQADDLPDLKQCIIAVEPERGSVWYTLQGHFSWLEQGPIEEERFDGPRRQLWLEVRGYMVKRQHTRQLLRWLTDQHLTTNSIPGPEDLYHSHAFIGEYPWATSCHEAGITDESTNEHGWPHPVSVTAAWFLCESGGFDCSINDSVSGWLPSPWLVCQMDIVWTGFGFDFEDEHGTLTAFDPSAHEAGPRALLSSKDGVESFLDGKALDLVWVVIGGREVIGSEVQWLGALDITAIYLLSRGRLSSIGFAACERN